MFGHAEATSICVVLCIVRATCMLIKRLYPLDQKYVNMDEYEYGMFA